MTNPNKSSIGKALMDLQATLDACKEAGALLDGKKKSGDKSAADVLKEMFGMFDKGRP